MPACQRAFHYHEVGQNAEALVPQLAQGGRGPGAGHNGSQRHIRVTGNSRQIHCQACAADHRVHTGLDGGADAVRILGGGNHCIDGNHAQPAGQLFGFFDLPFQDAQMAPFGSRSKSGSLKPATAVLMVPMPPQAATAPARPPRDTPTPMPPCRMGSCSVRPRMVTACISLLLFQLMQPLDAAVVQLFKMVRRGRTSCSMPAT